MIIVDDDGIIHKVLPMDTLDKLRAEIKHYNLQPSNYPCDMISIGTVLQIIDRYRMEYKSESEHSCGQGLRRASEIIDRYRNEVSE